MHLYYKYPSLHSWQRAGRSGNRYFDNQQSIKKAIAPGVREKFKGTFSGPLVFFGFFYLRRPKIHKKLVEKPVFWSKTPDIDNCEKFVFDMLQKYAGVMDDDKLIVSTHSYKLWGDNDATAFILGDYQLDCPLTLGPRFFGYDGIYWDINNRAFKASRQT